MKTFSIYTLGCKVNQYESQQMRQLLEKTELTQVAIDESPELVIVNTCCVTQSASAKSRRFIQKTQTLNPQAVIVVAGCLPISPTGELATHSKNVHTVKNRDDLPDTLSQIVNGSDDISLSQNRQISIKPKNVSKIKSKKSLSKPPIFSGLTFFKGHTRAFLKVQDGCDGHCTYCIIPKTRPIFESKPADTVLEEAQALVNAGHKEIVVTGIFLGAYGQETARRRKWPDGRNDKLAELLEKLAKIPSLLRIRLSSLEPADITERLLDVFCNHRNIMPHLHLSVQSGSDAVLKKMCRQYGSMDLLEKIRLIKSKLDRPALTGDFIVGFPGESDDDFDESMKLAKEIGFSKLHVFSFSARKGTAAASMQGQLNKEVIKHRSKQMQDLAGEMARDFRGLFLGESAEVLIEDTGQPTSGKSERYFDVEVNGNGACVEKNDLVKVKLLENKENRMIGEISAKVG